MSVSSRKVSVSRGGGGRVHERVHRKRSVLGKQAAVGLLATHGHPKNPVFPAKRVKRVCALGTTAAC